VKRTIPERAHLNRPAEDMGYTVEECDEVLARGCSPTIADAWLDERNKAKLAEEAVKLSGLPPHRIVDEVTSQ
jgi:hypothetical protein